MKIKVTLTLEDKPWKALRVRAIEQGMSASNIIDKLIAQYLKSKAKKGAR